MTGLEIAWTVIGCVMPASVGIGFGVVGLNPPAFKLARGCLWFSALILATMDIVSFTQVSHSPWHVLIHMAIAASIIVLLPQGLHWIGGREITFNALFCKQSIPSLVFVFGAPLGDNDSSTWIMMLKHYGPDSAHNCNVAFFDDDRKNIEHLWLINHGSPPFLPPGQFDESQKILSVVEAGPEGTIQLASFNWIPIDPDRQHYTVSISCRSGVFIEKWEVTRVNGVLRSRLVIEHGPEWVRKNPKLDRVVFKCEDPEFINSPLATTIPSRMPQKVVHPGWKPNYRFEVPVAIVDPNGHIQTVSGVKQRDGSTHMDFGCWNILTRHFGDAPSTNGSDE
jgi:hypothetical protein